jgi:prepilin-type N-terminal cleavage/methylation domain-containing protein
MKTPPPASAQRRSGKARGFTLVEIMTAAAVAGLVLAAVASVLVVSLRLFGKNRQIDDAITNTRLVQEHLNAQMAIAVSQKQGSLTIRPSFSDPSTTTPVRYAVMMYRVPIGSFGTVVSDTSSSSSSISVTCPADVVPEVGDYFMMDSPNLGLGILINSVTMTPVGGASTDSTAAITLATTLAAGTDASSTVVDALAGKLVHFQRPRKYETVPASVEGSPFTELRWYENTHDESYVVLSKNVDTHARYLFAQIPDNADAEEASVSWQFTYVSTGSNLYNMGGDKTFYQSNYAEGLVMPKSGDPLSASSILGGGPTTAVSTTTLGTSTTLLSTSTTKVSSTTKLTSTTKVSTTTTQVSTTTTQVSTTTTKASSSTTTTKGTSTTKVSSTTTTRGTTTQGTTTTTKGTTTTTLGTSTTKLSTTTKGTSTTQVSTTTTKASTTTTTSKASSTTTTKATTTTTTTVPTTIPFDG